MVDEDYWPKLRKKIVKREKKKAGKAKGKK
jgi:hypothetical protein